MGQQHDSNDACLVGEQSEPSGVSTAEDSSGLLATLSESLLVFSSFLRPLTELLSLAPASRQIFSFSHLRLAEFFSSSGLLNFGANLCLLVCAAGLRFSDGFLDFPLAFCFSRPVLPRCRLLCAF
jgi:hypothetical protein